MNQVWWDFPEIWLRKKNQISLQKLGGGFSSRKAFSGFDWHERKSTKIFKVEMYRYPKFTSFGNSSNEMDDSCVLFFGPPIRLKHW